MACGRSLKGLGQSCQGSAGGIKNVWIAQYADDKVTVENGVATIDTAFVTGTNFYRYYFKKNTASMTSTFTIDPTNGVNFVSTDLNLVFSKQDTTKRLEVQALALTDMLVAVEDANGNFWILGYDNPVAMTAGTGNSGTAKTDGNNYQITLNDESTELPYPLSNDTVNKLKAIAFPESI